MIDELYDQWLQMGKPIIEHPGLRSSHEGEWDEKVPHVSDVGRCVRRTVLRISGAEKATEGERAVRNRRRMFDDAKEAHDKVYRALAWHGELVESEVDIVLPPPFVGRADLLADLDGLRIGDVKTRRPGYWGLSEVKNYLMDEGPCPQPSPHEACQVVTYHLHEPRAVKDPVLYVRDMGGSNTSLEMFVKVEEWKDMVTANMAAITEALVEHAAHDTIPPPIRREMKWKGRTKIALCPPWDCDYCEYLRQSCPGPQPFDKDDLSEPMDVRALYYKANNVWKFSELGTYYKDEIGELLP